MTVIWIATHPGTAADNNAARGRERIVYISRIFSTFMDFLRSSTRMYQFRVKPVARCLAKKERGGENKKCALVCLVESVELRNLWRP